MKKILAIALAACMALTLVACGGLDVTKLTMPTELNLEAGQTSKLEITYDGEATAEDVAKALEKAAVVWTTSDEAVATVGADGTVTAVAAGEADVTVTSEDGKTALTCHVTVTEPEPMVEEPEENTEENATKIAVDSEGANAMEAIKATGVEVPEEIAADQLTWTSSDESVATVDATGHVTPVGIGTCVITATGKLADGQDWTAQCCFSIQETVDEEPAAETTDKDSSKDTKTDSKNTSKTDSKKNGSTATGGETVSGGNEKTPNPTPAPAPNPTPAPDTGNNSGNAVTDGGHGNDIIPGAPEQNPDGTWEGDGGNAEYNPAPIPPEPDPVPPADNGGNAVTDGGHGNDIIQGAPEQNPDGSWEGDGGNAEYNPAPIPPEPTF